VRFLLTLWFAITAEAFGQIAGGAYTISTAAGSGWVGDSGSAITAILFQAEGVAVDASANLYIADAADHRVRKVTPDGTITTVAGTGAQGFSGDGGPATAALLNAPYGLACDPRGNLYIADLGNARVRKVGPDGTIRTIALLTAPRNLALDNTGNLFISDFGSQRVYRFATNGSLTTFAGTGVQGYSGDGGPAFAAALAFPAGLAFDSQGSLYIGDTGNHVVRKVTQGVISTFTRASSPTGLAFDHAGRLYVADPLGGQTLIVPPSGSTTALPIAAYDVAFSTDGSWYASTGAIVWHVASAGAKSVAAGGGNAAHGDYGQATAARLKHPSGVAMDSAGNLYIADRDNHRVRRVSADGTITTTAGMGVAGNSGDGGPATSAQLNAPNSVAVDASGSIYIADTGNARVRMITPDGYIRAATVGGLISPVYAIPDATGNIYIADEGPGKILKAGANGVPATILAGLKSPHGLAFDSQGDLYFTEAGAARVRKMAPNGSLTYLANGIWNTPRGISVDSTGQIFVADTGLQQILRIDTSGQIKPVAGTGTSGFSGDGGTASNAQLSFPWDVAAGAAGALAVADLNNNRVRMLAPAQAPLANTLASAVNAASLLVGPVAPGMLVLLRNIYLATAPLPEVQVLFGASATPIVSADANGILVLAPQEIAGLTTTDITVLYQNAPVAVIPVVVVGASPALFTDSSGQAAANNQDGTVNSASNPAARGSIVSLYGTGFGVSSAPVSVTIGEYPADVLFTGPVPAYPGLFQVNARIPSGYIAAGDLSVVVSVGSVSTQAGLLLWID
jgi:uncharacterized protein (TIGR03437 family)